MRSPFLAPRKPQRQRDRSSSAPIRRLTIGFRSGLGAADQALRRLRPRGFLRLVSELIGDGLTLFAAVATLALALAMPAIEATAVNWRDQGDYAVTFLDRNGNKIGRRGIRQIDSVPLGDMPDYLIAAVLATEDRRFNNHFGIDVLGTARALLENLRAEGVVQGGSSITQQVARLLYLNNDRTIERKIQEAFIAIWLEATLTKDEILEIYRDTVDPAFRWANFSAAEQDELLAAGRSNNAMATSLLRQRYPAVPDLRTSVTHALQRMAARRANES